MREGVKTTLDGGNLRQRTISGITWSIIDNGYTQVITFVVGIILARLLEPSEFGLVAMIAIFVAIAHSFVDSGFSQALIRKNDCGDKDYNTVFYFNIFVSVLFYFILFFTAGLISSFFKNKSLIDIVRVLGLVVILNSFGIVHSARLTKEIDIKTQAKIAAVSNTLSGIVAIYLAFVGFGVWSLVWRSILNNSIRVSLLWLWHKWRPRLMFSIESFRELFGFGSKLLASGLLDTIFQNLYYVVIGRYFSPDQLGYYTRASTFANLPSSNITAVIQRVSYPVLAKIQDNPVTLKAGYKNLIKNTMFVTFVLMLVLAAIARPLIVTLIGEKWSQSVVYLQLLCFSMMLYPLHALNLNILVVKGRSDLFLKLEVIKKILMIPVLWLGVVWGIIPMLIGIIMHSVVEYFLDSRYSGLLVDYDAFQQIKDIMPSFLFGLSVGAILFAIGSIISTSPFILLIVQLTLGISLVLAISEILKLEPYFEIKEIVMTKFLGSLLQ